MTTWTEFLQQTPPPAFAEGSHPEWQAQLERGFLSVPQHLGLIQAEGSEAKQFLHNQLSNDVLQLRADEIRLAAYCTAKGRMLASLLYWQNADVVTLQLPTSLLAAIQKRLQMFVLRAKVKLRDASAELITLGLAGAGTSKALAAWFAVDEMSVNSKLDHQDGNLGILMRLPDALGQPRYQWILPQAGVEQVWPNLQAALILVDTNIWQLLAIHSGIPTIVAETVEQFVPQMINYEIVGGVNFKKGCYPGQEIVARSQYLGKLKRRMYLAQIDLTRVPAGNSTADFLPGSEIFSSEDPAQACGMIVNSAHNPSGSIDCLLELKVAFADTPLFAGAIVANGAEQPAPQLKLLSLPYAIPAQEH